MAEVKHFNTSEGKKRLDLDWELLLDEYGDDRPPDIVITPAENSKGRRGDLQQPEMEEKDTVYQNKTDGELEGMISRIKTSIVKLGPKLPDKGENYRATLRRCTAEVERRKRNHLNKGDTRCKVTLQLSDGSDDGTPCEKIKSHQKSSASPTFAKLFCQKMDGDKSSRTVNAFQDELSFFNPFRGTKMKENCQQLSTRSKQFKCATTLKKDSEKQRISNADKKVNHFSTSSPRRSFRNRPSSSTKAHTPKKPPQKKLRPKHASAYHLVDEEPTTQYVEEIDDWAQSPHNPPSRKSSPRYVSTYSLVDEEPLADKMDDWEHAPHSPPSRKLRSKHRLVDEEDLIAEKLDDCMQDVIVYYPSRDDQDAVEVIYRDMACLAPKAYLSSTIMNFYIRYLQQMTSSENIIENFHFFNTYFYNKLQKLSYKKDSFLKFRKWWKGVNIFEKSYLLIPIHEKAHWSLGIICFPSKEDELGPIVLHLDSLGLHDSNSIIDNIRSFVKEEWSYLKNSKENLNLPIMDEVWENLDRRMDDKIISAPQQRNAYDCGLFVLYYIERFIKEAPPRLKDEQLSMLSKKWFEPQEASNLRTKIHNLLVHQFKISKQTETISSPKSC